MSNKPLPEEDKERFGKDATLKRSLQYEFAGQITPGLWQVIRKDDRFKFLAIDETHHFQDESGSPTPLGQVLNPDGMDMMNAVMRLLNHENLVNYIDWIHVQTTPSGTLSGQTVRQFTLWESCNAGTLENLFMDTRETQPSALHYNQILKERASQDPPRTTESKRFLPEAFCWHVICSVLKALAWLHDGLRDEWDCTENTWVLKRCDIDWHTVLHRNISPDNIFFCPPQTRFETYGLCKLGNFSNAYVSGVFNGVLKVVVPPAKSQRVVAPQTGVFPWQDELRKQDFDYRNPTHPPTDHQPYTISSEYRALADVIVAMMVPPTRSYGLANQHWRRLQALGRQDWENAIHATPYTKVLKNFVVELMAKREVEPDEVNPFFPPEPIVERTYHLYKRARDLYDKFRTVKDEGKDTVTAIDVQNMQRAREQMAADEFEAMLQHRVDILDDLETGNRFTGEVVPPTSLELLLEEIDKVCAEIDSEAHKTQFRPGMMYL